MADSILKKIVIEFKSRLSEITTDNGFHTNAGEHIHEGNRPIDERQDNELFIYTKREVAEKISVLQNKNEVTLAVEGTQLSTGETPELELQNLIADIKDAVINNGEQSFGGNALESNYVGFETKYPEPGGSHAVVQLEFEIVYREKYGDPYSN